MLGRTLAVVAVAFPALAHAERAPVTAGEVPTLAPSAVDLIDRWIDRPFTFDMVGIIGAPTVGLLAAIDLDYAPMPWVYVQGRAGFGGANWLYGGSLHVRQIFGRSALSLGGGLLYTAAREGHDDNQEFLGPETITDYSYSATTWATAEAALEIRATDGMTLKFIAGLDHAIAGGAYTCMSTTIDNGLFGSGDATSSPCAAGTATDAPYIGFSIGYSPKL